MYVVVFYGFVIKKKLHICVDIIDKGKVILRVIPSTDSLIPKNKLTKLFPIKNDRIIDVTKEHCPMTFVYVRLALDQMKIGQNLVIYLTGEESYKNIKRSIKILGHDLIAESYASNNVIILQVLKKE